MTTEIAPPTEQTKIDSFTQGLMELCGLKLRSPTMYSLLVLLKTGNKLIDHEPSQIKPEQVIQDVALYLLLHSRPMVEVQALNNSGQLDAAVLEIADAIPVSDLLKTATAIHEHCKAVLSSYDWQPSGAGSPNLSTQSGQQSTSQASPG